MKNIFYLILLSILIMSCGSNVESPSPIVTETEPEVVTETEPEVVTTKKVLTQKEIDSFYDEITIGSEYNNNNQRFWYKKDVYIYLYDRDDSVYVNEFNKIVDELNYLIERINIVVTDNIMESNLCISITDDETFIKRTNLNNPRKKDIVHVSLGVVFSKVNEISNEIVYSKTFVKKTGKKDVDFCTLREELTQSLGFYQDTYSFNNSVFSQIKREAVLEYTELDKAIIIKHYSK